MMLKPKFSKATRVFSHTCWKYHWSWTHTNKNIIYRLYLIRIKIHLLELLFEFITLLEVKLTFSLIFSNTLEVKKSISLSTPHFNNLPNSINYWCTMIIIWFILWPFTAIGQFWGFLVCCLLWFISLWGSYPTRFDLSYIWRKCAPTPVRCGRGCWTSGLSAKSAGCKDLAGSTERRWTRQ